MINKMFDEFTSTVRQQLNLPAQIRLWSGETFDLGTHEKPKVVITVNSAMALPSLVDPTLDSLGTAYISGQLDVDGSLFDIMDLSYALSTFSSKKSKATSFVAKIARGLQERSASHTRSSDKSAIQYHYDVSNAFYQLWLDENMLYSCAYFERGDEDLKTAQLNKLDHILRKIRVRPGDTLLDIGCGWGGLAIRAAQKFGAHVTGVTLSQNQYDLARERVRALGLEDKITIELKDYRDVEGQFDRITSVGMFEHVGRENLVTYFSKVNSLLKPGGLCMNHGITLSDGDQKETPLGGGKFIDTYVFPDGELPHISMVLQTMQRGGLEALDVENLRRHYVRTLKFWSDNFEARTEAVRKEVEDKQYRIWRVYLAGCCYAFDLDHVSIYQVLCHKAGQPAETIEWSRRYMYP